MVLYKWVIPVQLEKLHLRDRYGYRGMLTPYVLLEQWDQKEYLDFKETLDLQDTLVLLVKLDP